MSHDGRQHPNDAEIVAMVHGYLDGALTPEEQTALFDGLRRDDQVRRLFVRGLIQATYLHEVLVQQRSDVGEPAAEDESPAIGASLSTPILPASALDPAREEGPIDLTPGASSTWAWLTGRGALGLVALAAVVLSGVLLLGPRGGDRTAGPAANEAGAGAAKSTAGVQFDSRSIHVAQGSVKVTLPKVGYMLIDGPADVDLVGPLRAKLNQGRVRVRVTEATGRGFAVETPDGEVVDLSTEFGVEVAEGKGSGVVVFDGAVDLHVGKSEPGHEPRVERLTLGEGATFNRQGDLGRVGSIMTGSLATFVSNVEPEGRRQNAVILKVADDFRREDTKKFYEIVPRGFAEDTLAYVDRPHEWNGLNRSGLPKFLLGADYVKTFSDDKAAPTRTIRVWLSRPAKLYVIHDGSLKPPKWLASDFHEVEGVVGMDLGPWPTIRRTVAKGVGPGERIDHWFRVWEREVKQPGVVTLGGNGTIDTKTRRTSRVPYMYGIAAVALDSPESRAAEASSSKTQPTASPVASGGAR